MPPGTRRRSEGSPRSAAAAPVAAGRGGEGREGGEVGRPAAGRRNPGTRSLGGAAEAAEAAPARLPAASPRPEQCGAVAAQPLVRN